MRPLFIIIITLLLSSCVTSQKISNEVTSIFSSSPRQEGKIIDLYSKEQNGKVLPEKSEERPIKPWIEHHVIQSPELSAYLNRIKDTLLEQWPRNVDHEISIYVTTNRSFTAYSTPWDIVLSMGVLADITSEDELAFIIGHEMSHILLGHHDIHRYFEKQEKLVDFASRAAMVANVLDDMELVERGGKHTLKQKNKAATQRKIRDAYKIGMAVNSLSNDIIDTYLNRENEEEADLLGTDLIVRAGYSAFGYGKALERVESSRVYTKAQLAEKKAKYQGIVTTLSSSEIPQNGGLSLVAYLMGNELFTNILQELAESYYSPDERKTSLATYLKREYRKERRLALKEGSIQHFLKNASCEQILDNYWKASEAIRALDYGEIEKAKVLAIESVRGETSGHSYPRLAFSMVREAEKDMKKAAANMNLIKNWEGVTFNTICRGALLNRRMQRYDKALAILELGGKALGDEPAMYPEMIRVHRAAGNSQEVALILDRCNELGNSTLLAKCQESAGVLNPADKDGTSDFNIFNIFKKAGITE